MQTNAHAYTLHTHKVQEFCSDYCYNNSHNLYKNKQQGINTSQWITHVVDFFDPQYYKYYLDATIGNSSVPVVLHLISLSLSLFSLDQFFYPVSLLFSPFVLALLPFASLPPFIASVLPLITTTVLHPANVSRIFFPYFIGFLPTLS